MQRVFGNSLDGSVLQKHSISVLVEGYRRRRREWLGFQICFQGTILALAP